MYRDDDYRDSTTIGFTLWRHQCVSARHCQAGPGHTFRPWPHNERYTDASHAVLSVLTGGEGGQREFITRAPPWLSPRVRREVCGAVVVQQQHRAGGNPRYVHRRRKTPHTAQRWARISVQQSTLQLPSTEYTTTPHTTAYSTRSLFPFPARHDVTTEYRHYTSVHRSVRYPRSLCSWFVVDLLSLERGFFSLHSPRSGFWFAAVVDPPCGGRACVRVNVSLTRMRACVRYAHR